MFRNILLSAPHHFIFLSKVKGWSTIGLLLFFLFCGAEIKAQVQVYAEQQVAFGSFVIGNVGGTVAVSHTGDRTATGDILLVNQSEQFHPVIFGVEASLGTVVHIQNGPDVQLTGSNGGEMTLSLGESSHGSSFISGVAPPDRTFVSISATLSAGSSVDTPPENYSGALSVTFIQE